MSLLDIKNIEVFYTQTQALFDVSLQVKLGEVVALMGRNGVGKSTTIRAICQLTPAKSGSIVFEGESLIGLPPHKAAQRGLGLAPEGRRCFGNLTVYENLIATARKGMWDIHKIHRLFPRLAERKNQFAATLSGGEQQMLAIGRALLTNPKLLILDEATEGLAPIVRQEIWGVIHQLRNEGQSILIIDKTLKELLPVCDHCFILEKGRSVWNGTPKQLSETVSQRYLGV